MNLSAHLIVWGGAKRVATGLVLLMLCFWTPVRMHAAPDKPESTRKADHFLRDQVAAGARGARPVIITMKSGDLSQPRLRVGGRDRTVKSAHTSIGAFATDVDVEDLDSLEDDPNVASVSIDARVSASQTVTEVMTLDMVRADLGMPATPSLSSVISALSSKSSGASLSSILAAATAPTGNGVRVAIIDSGIANIPDLSSQIVAFYDFTNGGRKVTPYDDYGHGTHVAGIIGSSGQQTKGLFKGIAPGVTFVGLKVLDANGSAATSTVLAAIQFAVANKAQLGIDVINLSLGHPIFEPAARDPLVQAVERAVKAGIVVVVSAGNYGANEVTGLPAYGGIASPGNAPSVITVGTVKTKATLSRADDYVAEYSSRGPSWYDGFLKPDVVAPGHRIVSNAGDKETLTKLYPDWKFVPPAGSTGQFLRLSGTSMSTAVVTGIVAQILELNRTRTMADGSRMDPFNPYVVKAIIEYTATNVTGADALTQGSGEVNAAGAVALTKALDTSGPATKPWSLGPVTQSTVFPGATMLWAQNVAWNDLLVQAAPLDGVLWGVNVAFSKNIVWGNAAGRNIVWGNAAVRNIVWGNSIAWANNLVWGNGVMWGNSITSSNSDVLANQCNARHEVCY